MNTVRKLGLLTVLVFSAQVLWAEVNITQIDPGRLLTRQQVDVYVAVTDPAGVPAEGLSARDFRLYESPDGEQFTEIRSFGFSTVADLDAGITFYLLLDNSGSMYDTIDDERTDDPEEMRITHAKRATRVFLDSVDHPRDRIGLASFNTFYRTHSGPIESRLQIERLLDEIRRPGPGEGFTELYKGIIEASRELADARGRKVLIVLSDGENYPFTMHRGQPHPEYGTHVYEYTESIEQLEEDGVSVFGIHFGTEQEDNLNTIARSSGGRVYDARDDAELADVYVDIRERVLREYVLSYAPTMDPSERKYVQVEYEERKSDPRSYFAGTILGTAPADLGFWALLPVVLALALWALIRQLRLQNRRSDANLEVLAGGRAATRMFSLPEGRTMIGGSDNADLTIHGAPEMRAHHATVLYNAKTGRYRVESDSEIAVNNQPTTKQDLEAGDVLNIGGTIVVFDEGAADPHKTPDKDGGKGEAKGKNKKQL